MLQFKSDSLKQRRNSFSELQSDQLSQKTTTMTAKTQEEPKTNNERERVGFFPPNSFLRDGGSVKSNHTANFEEAQAQPQPPSFFQRSFPLKTPPHSKIHSLLQPPSSIPPLSSSLLPPSSLPPPSFQPPSSSLPPPPSSIGLDEDFLPEDCLFLLGEEDNNLASFRENVEKEKGKLGGDIECIMKEISNAFEQAKVKMIENLDSHYKNYISKYGQLKELLIEFKNMKLEMPIKNLHPTFAMDLSNLSNGNLIRELEDLRYQSQMSKMFHYVNSMRKEKLALITNLAKELLILSTQLPNYYNSEAFNVLLKDIKGLVTREFSLKMQEINKFVKPIQNVLAEPKVPLDLNGNQGQNGSSLGFPIHFQQNFEYERMTNTGSMGGNTMASANNNNFASPFPLQTQPWGMATPQPGNKGGRVNGFNANDSYYASNNNFNYGGSQNDCYQPPPHPNTYPHAGFQNDFYQANNQNEIPYNQAYQVNNQPYLQSPNPHSNNKPSYTPNPMNPPNPNINNNMTSQLFSLGDNDPQTKSLNPPSSKPFTKKTQSSSDFNVFSSGMLCKASTPLRTPSLTPSVSLLSSQEDIILCLYAINDDLIAMGSKDCTISLYKISLKTKVATLEAHQGSICCLTTMKIGGNTFLASGSDQEDGSIIIWDIRNLAKCAVFTRLKGHEAAVVALAGLSDGNTLISGSYDKEICIWNVNQAKIVQKLSGHDNSITSIILSREKNRFVSAGLDNMVNIWKINYRSGGGGGLLFESAYLEKSIKNNCFVCSLNCLSDSKTLLTGGKDGKIKLFNLESGNLERTLTANLGPIVEILVLEGPSQSPSLKENLKEVFVISASTKDQNLILTNIGTGNNELLETDGKVVIEFGCGIGPKLQWIKRGEEPEIVVVNQSEREKGITLWKLKG